SVGAAQKGTAAAPATANSSSGTADHLRPTAQLREEALDLLPDLGAAGEAAPAHAHQAYQPVALVDGNDEVLARVADPVDQQRLHVGLELGQDRVGSLQLAPGVEAELGLGGAGRARVEGHHAARRRAVREEGEADRH